MSLTQYSQPLRKNVGRKNETHDNFSIGNYHQKEIWNFRIILRLLSQVSYKLGPFGLLTRNVLDFKKLAIS